MRNIKEMYDSLNEIFPSKIDMEDIAAGMEFALINSLCGGPNDRISSKSFETEVSWLHKFTHNKNWAILARSFQILENLIETKLKQHNGTSINRIVVTPLNNEYNDGLKCVVYYE